MTEYRVALFGQKHVVQQFVTTVPRHPRLIVDDLSNVGLEARENAFQSYQFTVLMYNDQDPDALVWAHAQVRLHNRCRGTSLMILAPAVVEHLGSPPTLLQEVPISINDPNHAFHLLSLIATAIEARHLTSAAPTGPLPSLPGPAGSRPATPRAPRQQPSRRKLRIESSKSPVAPQWNAMQERLRCDEEASDRFVCTLSIALLMLLDAANLPHLQDRGLRSSIRNSVYAPKEITNRGLFEFLSYSAGLSSKEGTSISEVMAEDNLRSLVGDFVGGVVGENMHGSEWVPIDPRTVHDVFIQHICPRTLRETEIAICDLSKWPGMECYFINLWAQSIADQTGRGLIRKTGLYRKWKAWRLSHAWPFA